MNENRKAAWVRHLQREYLRLAVEFPSDSPLEIVDRLQVAPSGSRRAKATPAEVALMLGLRVEDNLVHPVAVSHRTSSQPPGGKGGQ